ncbi:ATP-binding protein [Porcincola sp. LCP21S3_C12]|uniref:ATP-binding protein n=1 Tax=Porcincola sp. LCP21S3_C12 TaxID=3438798 RepID=UPI003F9E22E7
MPVENQTNRRVPRRIAQAVIGSLKGGVVPRVGLPYITVGRKAEIDALLSDVDVISEGGASFRFIVGRYGSGKSFLLQTIRNYVMDRNFVVMDADLSPERKLTGTKGQGLATYRELIGNLATRTKPEGGALSLVLDRWISGIQMQVQSEMSKAASSVQPVPGTMQGTFSAGSPAFSGRVAEKIRLVVNSISGMVHGFDFARLLTLYFEAEQSGDDAQKAKVLKWFRGEYPTRTEARQDLGVNVIITDEDWYDYLKLFAFFFRQAGYQGLMVFVDELVNIYKIPNSVARNNNYEKILTMYNDALQGKAHYIGMLMSGTPQCIEDTRRGVYSYEALRSRLQEGRFSVEGTRDMMAPVIRLEPLSPEEMLVLTEKLTDMHAGLYGYECRIRQEERVQFIQMEYSRVGADSHITPREIIRDFIELLDILYQHPEKTAGELLNGQVLGDMSAGTSQFMKTDAHTAGRSAGDSSFAGPEKAGRDDENELTTFTL